METGGEDDVVERYVYRCEWRRLVSAVVAVTDQM